MQTLTLSSNGSNGRLLDSKTSKRLRAFRFLSQRYMQHEPNYTAEMIVFALIAFTAAWPMFSLVHALGLSR